MLTMHFLILHSSLIHLHASTGKFNKAKNQSSHDSTPESSRSSSSESQNATSQKSCDNCIHRVIFLPVVNHHAVHAGEYASPHSERPSELSCSIPDMADASQNSLSLGRIDEAYKNKSGWASQLTFAEVPEGSSDGPDHEAGSQILENSPGARGSVVLNWHWLEWQWKCNVFDKYKII